MKSTHYNENQINYYDIIIDINSFRHLKKDENNNDWGWNVEINKNFNYEEEIEKDYVSIGVLGNKNSGKSFILNKLYNYEFPNGFSISTKGISVKYPDRINRDSNIVLFDTVGFEIPLKETSDYKLRNIKDPYQNIQIINEIERERYIFFN